MIIDFSKYKLEILLFILFFYSLIFCNLSKSRVLFIESNDEAMSYMSGVPSDYQQVDYITSDGYAYINTSILAKDFTKISFVLSDVSQGHAREDQQSYIIWGTTGDSWKRSSTLYQTNKWRYHTGNTNCPYYDASVQQVASTQYNVIYTRPNVSVNGTEGVYVGQGGSSRPETQDNPICIWYCGNGSYSKYKLYSCIIEGSDGVLREFIPCYRKSDGVIGLYDRISKTFFTNAGSGSFTKGRDVVKRSDFGEVEYIESSGTQRIDTGIAPTDIKFGILGKFRVLNMSSASALIDLSNTTSPDNKRYGFQLDNSQSKPQWSGIMYQQWNNDNGTINTSTDYEFSYNYNGNTSFTINGITKTGIPTGSATLPNWNIFCQNCNGSYQRFFIGRLYWLQIYHNEDLVRDFIPCYRKSDGVIGMIDNVNKVFYTNDGSGTFTKGSDVN